MIYLVFLLFTIREGQAESCVCHNNDTIPCTFNITTNDISTDCSCSWNQYLQVNLTSPKYSTYCVDIPTTTTTQDPRIEEAILMRCYNSSMSEVWENVTKFLLVAGAVWITLWCLATIVINIIHKNKGHHRYIHLFEEIITIMLMVDIGIVNRFFVTKNLPCKIISILAHYLMVSAATSFFMESLFSKSMVHGEVKKNGKVPGVLNFIIPLILPIIPTAVTYLLEKDDYGVTLIHCFASINRDMMWGFVIPAWIMVAGSTIQSQLACLSCDMTRVDQDEEQCFWAKRSAKSLVLVAGCLFSIWLLTMHAADHYVFYLFLLDFILCLFFGPLIFVCHTFCHKNTCTKWGSKSKFGKLYYHCSPPVKIVYEEKIVYLNGPDSDREDDPVDKESTPKEKKKNAEKKQTSEKQAVYHSTPTPMPSHTSSQRFYSWLTDPYATENATDVFYHRG